MVSRAVTKETMSVSMGCSPVRSDGDTERRRSHIDPPFLTFLQPFYRRLCPRQGRYQAHRDVPKLDLRDPWIPSSLHERSQGPGSIGLELVGLHHSKLETLDLNLF